MTSLKQGDTEPAKFSFLEKKNIPKNHVQVKEAERDTQSLRYGWISSLNNHFQDCRLGLRGMTATLYLPQIQSGNFMAKAFGCCFHLCGFKKLRLNWMN